MYTAAEDAGREGGCAVGASLASLLVYRSGLALNVSMHEAEQKRTRVPSCLVVCAVSAPTAIPQTGSVRGRSVDAS